MKAEEKAKELVSKFYKDDYNTDYFKTERAKQYALISEDETIKRIRELKISGFTVVECNRYSSDVKKAIKKL